MTISRSDYSAEDVGPHVVWRRLTVLGLRVVSSDGSALAFAALDPTLATPGNDIYVTRLRNGVLEVLRLLGRTLGETRSAFQWEP